VNIIIFLIVFLVKVLFDIVHPADVHFFRNSIYTLLRRGDEVVVTSRKKDITVELLNALGIKHIARALRMLPG
jgi:predicted glycosyltransferase